MKESVFVQVRKNALNPYYNFWLKKKGSRESKIIRQSVEHNKSHIKHDWNSKPSPCFVSRYTLSLITSVMWYRRYRRPLPPGSAIDYLKKRQSPWDEGSKDRCWACVPVYSPWYYIYVLWTLLSTSSTVQLGSCSLWTKETTTYTLRDWQSLV